MISLPDLFLDACVFIAAAASSQGASALVMDLCKRGKTRPVATQLTLREAERNIRLRFKQEVLLHFYQDIADARLWLIEPAEPHEIEACSRMIAPKDAHVLAAAIRSNAGILLTLDRKHFMTPSVRQAKTGLAVQTPGDFLRQWVDGTDRLA